MAIPSVYKTIRPLMVICYCMGQFAVVCVTVERSDLLRYHRLSKSVIGLLLKLGTIFIPYLWYVDATNIGNLFVHVNTVHYIVVCMKVSSLYIWFYLGSKNIVQVFQAVDRMRETLTLMPPQTRQRLTNPRAHLWCIIALFTGLKTMEDAVLIVIRRSRNVSVFKCVLSVILRMSLLLQVVTIVSLIYTCSIAFEDSVQIWLRYRTGPYSPKKNFKAFCQLTLEQFAILKEVNKALEEHVLVILLLLINSLVDNILLSAQTDYPETENVMTLAWWASLSGFLFFYAHLMSSKIDRLMSEVLNTDVTFHGLSKRETAQVKMLMTQLQTRPKLTASGFVELTPALFLSLLSLSIDYLILLWQNKTFLRDMMRKDLMAIANNTMYNQ